MKSLMPELDKQSERPVYLQLYDYIKESILDEEIEPGEKLPSLRSLSKNLGISITTVTMSYNQLLVEGYIESRPSSGYFVRNIGRIMKKSKETESVGSFSESIDTPSLMYDLSCFDFNKWKKCAARVYTEYSHLLLSEGDPQGEYQLREEISKYIYSSRGVHAHPEDIVIGAGTQQITGQLSRILTAIGIGHVALEKPGYAPVKNTFEERGFAITNVPVMEDGISIELLPRNIRCAAYVNPSNQFPTGAMMPVGRRHELLKWASDNSSYIIEDDYDSELRYFGRPVPAMQGMDDEGRVVYLGSFSSTLYPSIKISYMILPPEMSITFGKMKKNYTQTCSKAEQLTLSLFMKEGLYQTNIRKLRSLYSQKLGRLTSALEEKDALKARDTHSGINMILDIRSGKDASLICEESKTQGLNVIPLSDKSIIFYYNQIPLEKIEETADILNNLCRY